MGVVPGRDPPSYSSCNRGKVGSGRWMAAAECQRDDLNLVVVSSATRPVNAWPD